MSLQDRMNALRPYFKGVEMYNEALIVRVVYPQNWKAYPSSDGRIKVTPSENDPNETYYYASMNESSYEEMFDLVEDTVKANQEIALKLQLLREKGNELKELFSQLSYDELQTLEFVTKKAKQKRGRKKKAEAVIKQEEEEAINDAATD